MKKKLFPIILLNIFFLININKIYSNEHQVTFNRYLSFHIYGKEKDLNNLEMGNKDLSFAELSYADIWDRNLRGIILYRADLYEIDFWKSDLTKAYLVEADLRCTNFDKVDLTEADLENSRLHGIKNLDKTISIQGANFKGVKGLTNKLKQYLRDHGAINIPADLIYDQNLEDARTNPVVIDHESKNRKIFSKRWFTKFKRKKEKKMQTIEF